MLNSRNIKLAIQKKGRLTRDSLGLLLSCGFDIEMNEQELFSLCKNFPLEIIYLRDDDIPNIVMSGASDLGIVHEILLCEQEMNMIRLRALEFGFCSLVIAAPKHSRINSITDLEGLKVSTSYPNTTRRYFDKHNISTHIIEMTGSVEIMPWLGISDAIVDLTSTGDTLSWHDLRIIGKIYDRELNTFLVSSPEVMANSKKRAFVTDLLSRLNSILSRRNAYRIMPLK